MVKTEKLIKLSYDDYKNGVLLETHADTVVMESIDDAVYIAAVRFGGYPEMVRGMADAMYGGGQVCLHIGEKSHFLKSHLKKYRKELSHDGIYAEATLMVQDEEQSTEHTEDSSWDDNNCPRKCYLFCEQGNSDQLFEELDRKTAVPLIPEFKDYILSELQKRKILQPLQVITANEKFEVWSMQLSEKENNIIEVVNDGLKSGFIAIPKANGVPFPNVNSVTQYLDEFGVKIAERIKNQFNPLFDPATEHISPEILAINENIVKNVGYSLYDAQLAVAEAHKRCLEINKSTLCIAECGSGKTKIGVTALHAYQQKKNKTKHFNVVMCPSHMTRKWVREIEESLPNTFAAVITSITELDEVYREYTNDNKTCYVIISKEKARDGYMKRPSVIWNERRQAFICPGCYEPVMMELTDCGSSYTVKADQFFFQRENKKNHKCDKCGSVMWAMLVSEQQSEWIKISEYGFIHRMKAHEHLNGVKKKPHLRGMIEAVVDNPEGVFTSGGAYNRFPLSTYIKRKMKGKIDGLVIDELHNYNNNSGQGDAMGELFKAAKKVVGLTGTLINGYSSGIFHLLYRIAPHFMLKDGKRYEKPLDFNSEYGVTESVYEIKAAEYNANRRTAKRKLRERQLPGVSPLVYSRFLMDSAAFLSLSDMGKELPEYEEIPVQLQMNGEVADEYRRIENRFKDILKTQKDISRKILSAYLGLLTVYPDQPYNQKPVVHPISGDELVVPEDTSCFNELHEKDNSVLDVVKRKTAEGGRVLVYTSWVRIDTQEKLMKLLAEHGYRAAVLSSTVPPNKREEWVENQVQNGIQVLITNPSLVETGLDLNDFTTLYYYNIAYNLFTLRQSSRRSWRINQRAPRIEVYFSYYEDTMQHRAVRLMASKMAVAGVIEGNFTDEGLSAMSECQDMTTALARELTMGIKNEVEDLSTVFKKMAILKPTSAVIEAASVEPVISNTGQFPDDFDPFAEEFIITDETDPFAIDISEFTQSSVINNEIFLPNVENFMEEAA